MGLIVTYPDGLPIDGPLVPIGNDAKIALMAAVILDAGAHHNIEDAKAAAREHFPEVEVVVFAERAMHQAWQESVVAVEMSRP